MLDLIKLGVDKSATKAELTKNSLPLYCLTKDSFKKAYQQKQAEINKVR